MTSCPICATDVSDNLARCPCCGADAGYPNVKEARAEAAELKGRADAGRSRATARGSGAELADFERALNASQAVVNVDVQFLHNLLSSEKTLYAPYSKLIVAGTRSPGDAENDRQRASVEGLLFGSWGSEITYAALALDGRGLGSYGLISIELRPLTIELRASVLEENSYEFVKRHRIVPGDPIPPGYRAPWDMRCDVGVAKLADRVTSATTSADHARLVLKSDGIDRHKDEFMEVHIYGPFNRQAIQRITVLDVPKDEADLHRLKGVKMTAEKLGIVWSAP